MHLLKLLALLVSVATASIILQYHADTGKAQNFEQTWFLYRNWTLCFMLSSLLVLSTFFANNSSTTWGKNNPIIQKINHLIFSDQKRVRTLSINWNQGFRISKNAYFRCFDSIVYFLKNMKNILPSKHRPTYGLNHPRSIHLEIVKASRSKIQDTVETTFDLFIPKVLYQIGFNSMWQF